MTRSFLIVARMLEKCEQLYPRPLPENQSPLSTDNVFKQIQPTPIPLLSKTTLFATIKILALFYFVICKITFINFTFHLCPSFEA